jgi:hypothetical protein
MTDIQPPEWQENNYRAVVLSEEIDFLEELLELKVSLEVREAMRTAPPAQPDSSPIEGTPFPEGVSRGT